MSEQLISQKSYSVEEYLALERVAEQRHEYHAGAMRAMAGGSRNHGALGAGIVTELTLMTRGTNCTTFNGDVKVRIDQEDRFLYPEASVVCGKVEGSDLDKHCITNPVLITEVLSPSTEAYDRGRKFMLYQLLPSLREYVLIDQNRPVVSTFYKNDQGIWESYFYAGLEDQVEIRSLGARINMAILYAKVEDLGPVFDPQEEEKIGPDLSE